MTTTIVLLVSREFLLNKLFQRLDELVCDPRNTNLLVMVDGSVKLFIKTRNLTARTKFMEKLCVRNRETSGRSKSQMYRRRRIAALHNSTKEYITPCDYILLIEDDGLFPSDGLKKLMQHYKKYPKAGFVEGLELGRWQSRYIGAWVVDNPSDPSELASIPYSPGELTEIHAGGMFFCLTRYENYIHHHFNPNETINHGPDIGWGLSLSRQGLKNYIDQSVIIDHYSETGRIFTPDVDEPRVITLKKQRGVWRFVVSIQR